MSPPDTPARPSAQIEPAMCAAENDPNESPDRNPPRKGQAAGPRPPTASERPRDGQARRRRMAFRMRENHERLHAATASEERGEGVTLFEGQIDRARPEGASTMDRALWDRKHIALAE